MSAARARPVHLRASAITLVFLGGAGGSGVRFLVGTLVPVRAGVPVATLGINVVGAFLLGLLLERLGRPGQNADHVRRLRLLLGTGGLGGFTTYSALATDTAMLWATHPGRAIDYAVGTVLVGAAASITGIWLGRRGGEGAPPPASVAR